MGSAGVVVVVVVVVFVDSAVVGVVVERFVVVVVVLPDAVAGASWMPLLPRCSAGGWGQGQMAGLETGM